MGNILKNCFNCKDRNKNDISILLAGLDNAGKTRTVGLLAGTRRGSEAPTVGFQPVDLKYRNRVVHLHDVGGSHQFRRAWRHYYADTHALIFVVDSADHDRLQECAQVLEEVLSHPYIAGKPILILANKQDLEGAMDDLDIVEKLNIESIVNRYKCPARVESYTTTVLKTKSGKNHIDPGLKKGYEWLLNYIIHRYDEIDIRVKADVNKEAEIQNSQLKSESKPNSNSIDPSITGFENPNYSVNAVSKDDQNEEGITVVRQSNDANFNKALKLSPLFGVKNSNEHSNKSTIELEARSQMRKLSPIVRKKAPPIPKTGSVDSFSDPDNVKPHRIHDNANKILARQIKQFKSQESLQDGLNETDSELRVNSNTSVSKSRFTEVSLGDADDSPGRLSIILKPESNKKLLPPIKLNNSGIFRSIPSKSEELGEQANIFVKSANGDERPKSASENVKKQIIHVNSANQKGILGLKSLRKNRTSPEDNTSLFMFDPNGVQETSLNKEILIEVQDLQSEVVVHPSL